MDSRRTRPVSRFVQADVQLDTRVRRLFHAGRACCRLSVDLRPSPASNRWRLSRRRGTARAACRHGRLKQPDPTQAVSWTIFLDQDQLAAQEPSIGNSTAAGRARFPPGSPAQFPARVGHGCQGAFPNRAAIRVRPSARQNPARPARCAVGAVGPRRPTLPATAGSRTRRGMRAAGNRPSVSPRDDQAEKRSDPGREGGRCVHLQNDRVIFLLRAGRSCGSSSRGKNDLAAPRQVGEIAPVPQRLFQRADERIRTGARGSSAMSPSSPPPRTLARSPRRSAARSDRCLPSGAGFPPPRARARRGCPGRPAR